MLILHPWSWSGSGSIKISWCLIFQKWGQCVSLLKKINPEQGFHINLQNENIQTVTEFKYLGLVLDSQLKFDKHIKKISKTIQSNLNCFKLIRHYIPNQAALLYMHAMIFSHISYCLTVWAQVAPTATKHICSLYNQALKSLLKKNSQVPPLPYPQKI